MKDLNFFAPYQGKNKEKLNTKIYIYGAAGFVGFLILLTLGINTFRLASLENSIKKYNSKLADPKIQSELKEAELINNKITTLKKYDSALMDVAISVKARDNVSDTLLNDINSTIPSEISFESLNISDNTVTIKGTSKNRTAVAELKHNLSGLSKMKDVYVNSIDSLGAVEGEYSFEVKCLLKDVG